MRRIRLARVFCRPGHAELEFQVGESYYRYATWDKAIVDEVRWVAERRPGRALALAKRCCALQNPAPRPPRPTPVWTQMELELH